MSFSIVKHRCPKRLAAMSFLIEQGYKNPRNKKELSIEDLQKTATWVLQDNMAATYNKNWFRTIQLFNQLKVLVVAEFLFLLLFSKIRFNE